mmetsp:Transcript_15099/g.61807  ORF Transcript_15099/g.61807 Transcript_15099/m.61807 type:complete len:247 (-) Transcript_15099:454-1194(-)
MAQNLRYRPMAHRQDCRCSTWARHLSIRATFRSQAECLSTPLEWEDHHLSSPEEGVPERHRVSMRWVDFLGCRLPRILLVQILKRTRPDRRNVRKRSQEPGWLNEMVVVTTIGKKGDGARETIERIGVRTTTGGIDVTIREERIGATDGETTEEMTVGMTGGMTVVMTVAMTVATTVGMTVGMTAGMIEEMIAEKEGGIDHQRAETMIDRGIPENAEEVGTTARTVDGRKMTVMMMSAHRRGAGGK